MSRVGSIYSRFHRDEQGNFAVIVAIMILPLLMFVGVGVEYSRISSAEGKMYAVIENSAVSLSTIFRSRPDAQRYLENMINANTGRDTARVKLSIKKDKLVVEAFDELHTPLLSTIGQTHTELKARLELNAPKTNGTTGNGVSDAQKRALLKRTERKLEGIIDRLRKTNGGTPAQRRARTMAMEQQLTRVRRQLRTLR